MSGLLYKCYLISVSLRPLRSVADPRPVPREAIDEAVRVAKHRGGEGKQPEPGISAPGVPADDGGTVQQDTVWIYRERRVGGVM